MKTGDSVKFEFGHPKLTLPLVGYKDCGEIEYYGEYIIIPTDNVVSMISLEDDLEDCLAVYKK